MHKRARVARGLAAASVMFGTFNVLSSDTTPGTAPEILPAVTEADQEMLAWQDKMREAASARRSIAQRFAGGCVITDVVDTHTSEARSVQFYDAGGFPTSLENVSRNKVILTVTAATTTASAKAEAVYANGTPDASLVRWYPFALGGATDILRESKDSPSGYYRIPIPAESTARTTGPNEETFTITMYPRTDKRRTTSANITLNTHVETYDHTALNGNGATYLATGIVSCGNIVERALPNGQKSWAIAEEAVHIPEFTYSSSACFNMPVSDDAQATRQKCL